MGRYGTREAELDDLLRRGVFVDLLTVVRNGLRASRPGYGLKEVREFLDFDRDAEIKDGGASIVVFEQWMQTRDDAMLAQIDAYNEEDCIATLLLRDWLLERREEAIAQFGPFPRRRRRRRRRPMPPGEGRARRAAAAASTPASELRRSSSSTTRRERKPVWWGFFDRVEMTPEELVEDSESIGAARAGRRARAGEEVASSTAAFPAQEHKIGRARR